VHGEIIFKWKLKKKDWGRSCELDWPGAGQGQVAGSCEKGDETLGSIKRGAFVDQMRKCFFDQLRKYNVHDVGDSQNTTNYLY
jgi:hypothetical protein